MAITVRFRDDLDERLDKLAKKTHRSKGFYIQQALEYFLKNKEEYFMKEAHFLELSLLEEEQEK